MGRASDGTVTHLATVTWDEEGVPAVRFHGNFFVSPNMFQKLNTREQPSGPEAVKPTEKLASGTLSSSIACVAVFHGAVYMLLLLCS